MVFLAALLVAVGLMATSCCDLMYDKADKNACMKFWYGLEPDPENPDVYKHGLTLWKDEAFGEDSGWQKTWVRVFGSKEEKQKLHEKIIKDP